ncbi:hypothetical protein [Chitinophaga nivalis]|uniref:Uncharacterized protein n=1 Tax=Chitinophaga nivalis TaxID=2991709 RepID=A0ABT3IEE8_9BACT|nr:hypothetical protein [Chitinophaga nivalis]MCW3467972.1 hypothetical protein [Chitinophaga nivalis]MCW3482337.1 hypothetical protein [Chitinophaga nivalis]
MKAVHILPDNQDALEVNGLTMRKGSVAAFLANVSILEQQTDTTGKAYTESLSDMLELVPVLVELGVFKHFILRSEKIRQLILTAFPTLTTIIH